MISYLAVVFFCAGDCYFWSGQKLHSSQAACQSEIAAVVRELDKNEIEAQWQCLRVPLSEA